MVIHGGSGSRTSMARKHPKTVGYIHLIHGQPGRFDGDQICYTCRSFPVVIVPTYEQLLKERRATVRFRKKILTNYNESDSKYGHIRVVA
jgi:hypothetical protein